MVLLIVVFLPVFLAVNVLLSQLAVRPVRKMALEADRVSRWDMSAKKFPQHMLVMHSFDRMRTSLEKAMRLLGD